MKRQKIMAFMLSVAILAGSVPSIVMADDVDEEISTAQEELTEEDEALLYESNIAGQGECGQNATWEYDDDTRTLTISGSGDMSDFEYNSAPWKEYSSDIESIVISADITYIGKYSFSCLKSVGSVTIPADVKSIGEGAFDFCESLQNVTFEEGSKLEIIGNYAFFCTALSSITIPDGVTSIGISAFEACSSLASANIPSGITAIANAVFKSTGLTSIAIPEGVTYIGSGAFGDCDELTTVVIPSSVGYIGLNAFSGCTNVKDAYFYVPDPDMLFWQDDAYSVSFCEDTVIHVPSDEYEDAYPDWNKISVDIFNISSGVVLAGHSLSLKGNIGVNFYMELSDEVLSDSDPYMLFTLENGKTQIVKVKSGASVDTTTVPGRTYYVFQCEVSSKETYDDIRAQMYLSDGTAFGDEYSYRVDSYAVYIVEHQDNYDEDTIYLAQALLNYGRYSSLYFGYNGGRTSYETDNDYFFFVRAFDIELFLKVRDAYNYYYFFPESVSSASAYLELESEIVMNFTFSGLGEDARFTIDTPNGEVNLPIKRSGNKTIVTISGINAQDIDETYDINIYIGSSRAGLISYKPVNYCYSVITGETTDVRTEALKDLMIALCIYNDAANHYVENHG